MAAMDVSSYIKKRHIVALLITLGTCIVNMMQLNLSITIVDLTSRKNITMNNNTHEIKPEYNWRQEEKGLLLSVHSYGLLFSPVGALLAHRIGGATVFGIGILVSGILTVLTPFCLHSYNMILFVTARFLEGTCKGIVSSSLMEIFVHWTPPNERSRMIVMGINGFYLGAAIGHTLSGFIASKYGWEAVFFTTGGIALVWCLIWFLFVSDTPEEDKYISEAERSYLHQNVQLSSKCKLVYPWKSILTSKPVWALLNEYFTLAWSFFFVLNCLPLYIHDAHSGNIENVGLISSIPNVCTLLGSLVAAIIGDYLRSHKILTVEHIYKIFISFGQISAIISLIVIALWMDFEGTIICLSIFRFCFSFSEAAYEVLPTDLASQYASLIRGLCTTISTIGYILSPTVMGYMTANHSSESWNRYFFFLSFFNMWSLVIFLIMGSSERQPWAEPSKITNNEKTGYHGDTKKSSKDDSYS